MGGGLKFRFLVDNSLGQLTLEHKEGQLEWVGGVLGFSLIAATPH